MRKDWQGAATTLTQQVRAGLASEADTNRKRAAILAALAVSQEDTKPDEALANARQALKLDPALVPAALVAARREIARGSARKAAKIIRETWKLSPHPDLAEVFAHLKPGEGPEARFERVRDLASGHDGGIEGAFALARAAIAAQRFDVARKALQPAIDEKPQARMCALMAEIEEAQGDMGRAREWLARAVRAPRDPVWVSDGVASLRWTPVSPVSGEIVPCEWRAPFEMIAEETAAERPIEPAAETAAKLASEAPRASAVTAAVEPLRPPDDPGPPDETPEPEAAARRSLAADG
jgi:HemY protein